MSVAFLILIMLQPVTHAGSNPIFYNVLKVFLDDLELSAVTYYNLNNWSHPNSSSSDLSELEEFEFQKFANQFLSIRHFELWETLNDSFLSSSVPFQITQSRYKLSHFIVHVVYQQVVYDYGELRWVNWKTEPYPMILLLLSPGSYHSFCSSYHYTLQWLTPPAMALKLVESTLYYICLHCSPDIQCVNDSDHLIPLNKRLGVVVP